MTSSASSPVGAASRSAAAKMECSIRFPLVKWPDPTQSCGEMRGWNQLLEEAQRDGSRGRPIRAYSELMPPPRVAVKPSGEIEPFTRPDGDPLGWNVHE